MGEAYGFILYMGKTEDIDKTLPHIRGIYEMPSDLEIKVYEGMERIEEESEPALKPILQSAKNAGMSHALKATVPHRNNRYAAMTLGDIINGIYTALYTSKGPFYGEIVYKHGDIYKFRRK